MSTQRFHLNLFQKALILIAVPLAFELLLLAALNGLLNEAEREARQAERARAVIAKTNHVVEMFFDIGLAFLAYDASSNKFFERRYLNLTAELPEEIEALKSLVKDNPGHADIVNRVSAGTEEAMRTLTAVKRRLDAGERLNLVHAFQLRQKLNGMVDELNVIIKEEQTSQKINPDASVKLKAMVKQLLAAGVVVSILLALALATIFHQGTARRLKTLVDNGVRLGRREKLTPLLVGDDEIAQLDRVIHDAEAALTEYARKERAVIENAVDVICSVDAAAKFAAVSPASLQLWGYKPEELVGRDWIELVDQGDQDRCRKWAEKLRSSGQSGPVENKVRRKDGSLVDMSWSATWSESEQSMFCVAHDITERKEVERFKQQFVAMVSHDLRTPLSAVQSTLSLLATGAWGGLSDRGQQKVATAKTNIRESIELINDLLDLEKMEAGKMEMQIAETELAPILQRSAEAISTLAETRAVQIKVPDTEAIVLADQGRLSQVVMNLLGNAVKFSPDGGVVSIGVELRPDWAEVRISDQGPGVPEAYQQAIFERFRQVPGTEVQRQPSTGLGLPICKAIVEAHGGTIGVDSEAGKGSTFWFLIPLKTSALS